MSTTTRTASRVAAGFGALAIGLLGFANTAAAIGPGNIDPNQQGQLIIHKKESGSLNTDGSVSGKVNAGGTGVADVVFTAYKIENLDLKTQEAWNGLKDYQVPADACGANWKTPKLDQLPNGGGAARFDNGTQSGKTNASGDTTIDNLSVAAYLVCETESPANVLKKAAPFLVTIPFPNNTTNNATDGDGEWLYNVNVYPKNTVVVAPQKGVEVTAKGLQTGAQVEFPVTAKVPSIAKTDSFSYFIISDPLNDALTDGKVKSVAFEDGTPIADTNYTVTTTGKTVDVGFTEAGLALLKANPNKTVKVVFTAKVNSVPTDGVIPNVANLYLDTIPQQTPPNNPPVVPPPGTPPTAPTNKVVTSWGAAQAVKLDKDNAKKLSGAKFQVFEATNPYADACTTDKTGAAIEINGQSEFTSDDQGVVALAGLFVDKGTAATQPDGSYPDPTWENGNKHHCYVLVETAAPAGYVLPKDGNELTALKVVPGNVATASTVDINNTKQDVPGLPLTGGSGQVIMLTGGLVMIVAAGALVLVRRRHAQA